MSRINLGGIAAKLVVLIGLWLFVGLPPRLDWWQLLGALLVVLGLDLVRQAYRSET